MLRINLITLLILSPLATASNAEPLFAVAAGMPGSYSAMLDAGLGVLQYDVVVLLNSDGEATSATEFVMSDLVLISPGVFKLATVLLGNPPIDLSIRPPGEYVFAYGHCEPAGEEIELARITYGNFQGEPVPDTVLTLRGFEPGDSIPSLFGGSPGVVDCNDNLLAGSMGGRNGGMTDGGIVFPDGSLVINPNPPVVPTATATVGTLKSRY